MYIYGKNAIKEALQNKIDIKKIYLNKNFNDEEILKLIRNFNIHFVNKNDLDNLVSGNHQGIVLETSNFNYTNLEDCFNDSLVIILDHLEDPHNFGAIIRTCEAAGVKSIIIPKDRSVDVNSTVIKVSTGAIYDVNIIKVTNLSQTIDILKKEGFWFIGTDLSGTDYKKINYQGKNAIIIGNEGHGISKIIKEKCDFIATIPMYGKTNSLNASVAAGIVIFEAIRKEG